MFVKAFNLMVEPLDMAQSSMGHLIYDTISRIPVILSDTRDVMGAMDAEIPQV